MSDTCEFLREFEKPRRIEPATDLSEFERAISDDDGEVECGGECGALPEEAVTEATPPPLLTVDTVQEICQKALHAECQRFQVQQERNGDTPWGHGDIF
jgi:hypothetical protein